MLVVVLLVISLGVTLSARVVLQDVIENRRKLAHNFMVPRASNLRVFEGRDAEDDEFRFIASLQFWPKPPNFDGFINIIRLCTGSLITPTWFVTAAHCTEYQKEYLVVRYGDVFTPFDVRTSLHSRVLRIENHHRYRSDGEPPEYDISLLFIKPAKIEEVGRLSAIQYTDLIGQPVNYAGFGMMNTTQTLDHLYSQRLQVGDGGVVPCDTEVLGFIPTVICVVAKCSNLHQIPFEGDSGGPLLFNGQIVGVTSSILSTRNNLNVLMFFTPISASIHWIRHILNETSMIK